MNRLFRVASQVVTGSGSAAGVGTGAARVEAGAGAAGVEGAAAGGGDDTVALSNGAEMPLVGYGAALFSIKAESGFDFADFPTSEDEMSRAGDAEIETVLGGVLDAGYRHIDSAHCYHTELPLGRALASRFESGALARDDVWITTKTSDPSEPPASCPCLLAAACPCLLPGPPRPTPPLTAHAPAFCPARPTSPTTHRSRRSTAQSCGRTAT